MNSYKQLILHVHPFFSALENDLEVVGSKQLQEVMICMHSCVTEATTTALANNGRGENENDGDGGGGGGGERYYFFAQSNVFQNNADSLPSWLIATGVSFGGMSRASKKLSVIVVRLLDSPSSMSSKAREPTQANRRMASCNMKMPCGSSVERSKCGAQAIQLPTEGGAGLLEDESEVLEHDDSVDGDSGAADTSGWSRHKNGPRGVCSSWYSESYAGSRSTCRLPPSARQNSSISSASTGVSLDDDDDDDEMTTG
jgi:hypothetical protein